ncbi:MAG: hypothetical protein V2A55_02180 [Candidatus Jorgensenbacteria bacterium]
MEDLIMKVAGGGGAFGGVPVGGALVSLDGADASALVGAAAGAVRAIALAGGGVFALGLLAAIAEENRVREDKRFSISALASVRAGHRTFLGVCLDSRYEFSCDDQRFSVSLDRIRRIGTDPESIFEAFLNIGCKVRLVDNSIYRNVDHVTEVLSFLTLAGIQEVRLVATERYGWLKRRRRKLRLFDIAGATWDDVRLLRQRLTHAIASTRGEVIRVLGEDVYARYFQLPLLGKGSGV